MSYQSDPVYRELTEQHPYTLEALRGIAKDLGIPYVFLVHEVYEAFRFVRLAEGDNKNE